MALQGKIVNDRRFIKVTTSDDTPPGTIERMPDGRAGIHNGASTVPSGGVGTFDTECIAEVVSASATTFAEGADVGWNNTTKLAVSTGGTFGLGKAARQKTAGQTTVLVALNATTTVNPT